MNESDGSDRSGGMTQRHYLAAWLGSCATHFVSVLHVSFVYTTCCPCLTHLVCSFTLHVVSVLHLSFVRFHYMCLLRLARFVCSFTLHVLLRLTHHVRLFTLHVVSVLHIPSVRLHYMCFCLTHFVFLSYTFRCSHLWHDVSPSYTHGVSSRGPTGARDPQKSPRKSPRKSPLFFFCLSRPHGGPYGGRTRRVPSQTPPEK